MTAQVQQKPTLTLKITALRSQEGVVCVALFPSAEGFPDNADKATIAECFPISEIPLSITFEDIQYGCYAVTVFHDENADGELNRGAFGIPQEGLGFSGNPRLWKGPPEFQQADFEFAPSHTAVEIEMKYF